MNLSFIRIENGLFDVGSGLFYSSISRLTENKVFDYFISVDSILIFCIDIGIGVTMQLYWIVLSIEPVPKYRVFYKNVWRIFFFGHRPVDKTNLGRGFVYFHKSLKETVGLECFKNM